jgi:hypothetical protein
MPRSDVLHIIHIIPVRGMHMPYVPRHVLYAYVHKYVCMIYANGFSSYRNDESDDDVLHETLTTCHFHEFSLQQLLAFLQNVSQG